MVNNQGRRMPKGWTAKILVLQPPTGSPEPFMDLYDFFVAKWSKSEAWQSNYARALGLLWDYTLARIPTLHPKKSTLEQNLELFRGFSNALLFGTIDENLKDPLELYWPAQPLKKVRKLISCVEKFADWVTKEKGVPKSIAPQKAIVSLKGKTLQLLAYQAMQRMRLLGYIDDPNEGVQLKESAVELPRQQDGFNHEGEIMLSFPPHQVENILWHGFLRPGKKGQTWDDYNIRGMMSFLLEAYAGLRNHEIGHIWIHDIVENPLKLAHASIFLYHPEEGLAFIDGIDGRQIRTTRKVCLNNNYDLMPRTRGTGGYKIGWKNSKMITKEFYALIHWTDPVASALFWLLYKLYIPRRELIMQKRRKMGFGDHPFLFVSERESRNLVDGARYYGAPASIEIFENDFKRAVRTIGLPSAKEAGTTPHGLRHLYAYTLKKLGVEGKYIQDGLRQRHPFSHLVYGNPSPTEISNHISEALSKNRDSLPTGIALEKSLKWLETRHPELKITARSLR